MSNYVDVDDDNFYRFINKKYSQYKIPKTHKTLKQICFPSKYEFQIPQKFLAEFINPKTPYKGILVYHRIGAGKTCTAINIAEKFKKIKNVMIVLPASLKGNFRSELRSPCAGNNYLLDTERSLLKQYHPSSYEYKEIIKKSDARIDKYYTIYSYNKFVQLIKSGRLKLNNTLLIIDEVHNMISETGTYYEALYDTIHSAPNDMRLVIMSATPIFDKPIEIALTMNLLLKDNQLPTGQDFVNTFMDIWYTSKGPIYQIKNMDIFKDYVRGYVSYFRGAPPHVFPRTELFFVKTKMSEKQQKLYKRIIAKEAKISSVKDYVNVDISNSFFIGTRMISNFVFPNGKIGKAGYDSLTESDFDVQNVKEYSPKFLRILRKIRRCEGTVFVYSNFKEYGGIKTFVRLLEHYGYKDYEFNGAGRKRFAIWSGDQAPLLKEEIKAVFNNKNNEDGSQIKVVLGSPSIKEGVSLLRVQEVHIMEPYWNMSRIMQVIGRAIRFCSHKDVPYEKQLVKVYIYMAVHPTIKRSIDQHIMHMAITKEYVNNQFEKALKESAVDCELFKNANVYPGEDDIICEV
ncbi:putative ATP-dependent RNA helicase [Tupanvirus deep ocean]|uniref:ATP-dependent RNA helicase n=2 Tax=Tupanvirus TaxID=2094720 RepID=A0AC62A7P9_9VIRU|nr:putative ATP-dependent RNA helicase [Tupanvirus deep ocean]QKU33648.1 putative ATP-dependent RNA helicase [Tupanvirus deep ocean]